MTNLVFALLLISPTPRQTDLPQPSFSAEVATVRLAVSVQRDGRAVSGLHADDFQVWDNGVAQQVQLIGATARRVHAVLALDSSFSVRGEQLARLKSAACAFLGSLRGDDHVTLLPFAETLRVIDLTGARDDECHQFDGIEASGSTALMDALFLGLQIADPRLGHPVVVAFSDGTDRLSWLSPRAVVDAAKRSEAVVYSVVTGPRSDLFETLASETGGRQWSAVGNSQLQAVFAEVSEDIRDRYVLRYEPAGVPASGWHTLRVRLKRGGGTLRYRRGYHSGPP